MLHRAPVFTLALPGPIVPLWLMLISVRLEGAGSLSLGKVRWEGMQICYSLGSFPSALCSRLQFGQVALAPWQCSTDRAHPFKGTDVDKGHWIIISPPNSNAREGSDNGPRVEPYVTVQRWEMHVPLGDVPCDWWLRWGSDVLTFHGEWVSVCVCHLAAASIRCTAKRIHLWRDIPRLCDEPWWCDSHPLMFAMWIYSPPALWQSKNTEP